jgi:phage replication-related protein YjqB (UPF0714/DUF867 family)
VTAAPTALLDHVAIWDAAENMFSVERYMGAAAADTVHTQYGEVPILFSAPHAVAHLREGFLKLADLGTGGLAIALAQVTGGYAVAQAGMATRDANWYADSTYKTYLDKLTVHADTVHADTVIDLHGMKDAYGVDVCIGTGRYSIASLDLLASLIEVLTDAGLRISINDPYDAMREDTVTSYCQRQGVQAIQLELSRTTRRQDSPQSAALVAALTELAASL